jgi:aromatic-L-amino-acid/L-tryptophan decarboxylase
MNSGLPKVPALSSPATLDPTDWEQFRRLSHAALDDMISFMATAGERPVWQKSPEEVRQRFLSPVPHAGTDLADVLDVFRADIKPYVTGNTHPLFMGWVHGAGNPAGMLGEMLAAGLNANCGGRDHIGIEVERQITQWTAELMGYPADASGLFVTGTSMANFLALLVARTALLGTEVRAQGIAASTQATLTSYTSAEAHGCVAQAMELAGLGSANLRRVPVGPDGGMRADRLAEMITEDRAAGRLPFMLVGTAGTVNTGAYDDLNKLADIAEREKLWFHIDGAFGALLALAPDLRHMIAGIERSQSIAFDFHKWAHVPYDAGFLLVRDPALHRQAFASPVAYLSRAPRGLAAGETWPNDLGPDLSRGFRALKTWFTLRVHGVDQIGACITHCCAVARHLEKRVAASNLLEVISPARSNIVCFSITGDATGARNQELVMDLHESGEAVPSITIIDGRPVIRCAIVNHRTTEAHIDKFIAMMTARLT